MADMATQPNRDDPSSSPAIGVGVGLGADVVGGSLLALAIAGTLGHLASSGLQTRADALWHFSMATLALSAAALFIGGWLGAQLNSHFCGPFSRIALLIHWLLSVALHGAIAIIGLDEIALLGPVILLQCIPPSLGILCGEIYCGQEPSAQPAATPPVHAKPHPHPDANRSPDLKEPA